VVLIWSRNTPESGPKETFALHRVVRQPVGKDKAAVGKDRAAVGRIGRRLASRDLPISPLRDRSRDPVLGANSKDNFELSRRENS